MFCRGPLNEKKNETHERPNLGQDVKKGPTGSSVCKRLSGRSVTAYARNSVRHL